MNPDKPMYVVYYSDKPALIVCNTWKDMRHVVNLERFVDEGYTVFDLLTRIGGTGYIYLDGKAFGEKPQQRIPEGTTSLDIKRLMNAEDRKFMVIEYFDWNNLAHAVLEAERPCT